MNMRLKSGVIFFSICLSVSTGVDWLREELSMLGILWNAAAAALGAALFATIIDRDSQ